eukprot:TRINITY_DN911_c0_g1_i1.p1 TRINITY_DN911_c0_g1~~TRINITY_DN911_c0_g1_i1.p1  ORF type:complete len:221 (-),score=-47.47 TRINITY_DN911_c0_g1_i1:199-861(-)
MDIIASVLNIIVWVVVICCINMFSPLEQFNVYSIIPVILDQDYSFNNILIPIIIIILLFSIISTLLYKNALLIPFKLQYVLEILVTFVFNILRQQIGLEGYIFLPIIFTLFSFILFSNYLSLLPAGIALTSHIIVTLFTSLSMCLSIIVLGFTVKKIQFLRNFIPQCPLALMPMLICIELFSYALRSFSLAIRLSANILAGHTLVYIIASSILFLSTIKL